MTVETLIEEGKFLVFKHFFDGQWREAPVITVCRMVLLQKRQNQNYHVPGKITQVRERLVDGIYMFQSRVIEYNVEPLVKIRSQVLLQVQEYLVVKSLKSAGLRFKISYRVTRGIDEIVFIVPPFFVNVPPTAHICDVATE